MAGRKFLFYSLFIFTYSFFIPSSAFSQDNTLSKKDTSEVRFINQRKFFIYKVSKEETLYSISKKFNIPQQEIEEFNPELKDGLKAKMKLWVPAYSHLKKSAGEPKPKEEEIQDVVYQVAIITALNIPQNYSFDSTLVDSQYINTSLSNETVANLEFYEGALLALDSLKKDKIKIHLHVFDSENDSLKLAEHLRNPLLKKMDLLMCNGNTMATRMINSFSKSNQIRFLSVTMNAGDIVHGNNDAIALYPSSLTQCMEMGKHVGVKFSQSNCIVLNTLLNKENERGIAFKKGWMETAERKIKNVNYITGSLKVTSDSLTAFQLNIKNNLTSSEENVLFVPSVNEDFVSNLVNELKEFSEQYRITLIGLPPWQYFETIDPLFLELLNVHIFTPSFINYGAPASINFRKKFYNEYNVEPMDAAFQGFDLMLVAGKILANHGQKTDNFLTGIKLNGLYTSYQFVQANESSFWENHYITVCNYRNYELKKIND